MQVVSDGVHIGSFVVTPGGGVNLAAEGAGAVVHVGLPFYVTVETMDILADQQNGTGMDRCKDLSGVVCFVRDSKDLWAGNNQARTIDANLRDGRITTITTGRIEIPLAVKDLYASSVVIRTKRPLPLELESLVVKVDTYDH